MRSKLFVPATRADFFAKALASDADAIAFDLEDAVPEDAKASARTQLGEFLASDVAGATSKVIIVRVNAPDTAHFNEDVASVLRGRIDLINLPKCDDGAAVRAAAERMAAAAEAPPKLLVNIETPRGLARAAEIASAHPMVVGLQVGLNDLFASLGIERRRQEHVHAALWSIRLAAGEAGCFAYDGAWPDLGDEQGYRTEAELARSLGYLGKSCVHPKQIAIANAVFGLDQATLDRARRIVAAARAAELDGRGAFTLDGEMIDRPAIQQAETMLAAAGPGQEP
ncbi:HpcH/HpaI aldolase/citrate lyase family protein [Sphingomonas psychrotolerans]|uniref:CoA ester lyase n=1 Tax=Sphingomonas psychrotolerans TaxID=1327635 RepID=A0A2K8MIV4_9SPHN|nr:CoA ester lyase [Sphingomonas psychrotolerans]ATY33818.1 CoA ester lyase [Sphingomonas psychrotolerans]